MSLRSAKLVRAGVTAMFVVIGLAITPRLAHASKVCAPDNRGCFYTREKCAKIESLPPRWTCTRSLAVSPQTDVFKIEIDGRATVSEGGKPVFILSDALEKQLEGKKVSADEYGRLVLADRGKVSQETLQLLSKELGLPLPKKK